MAALTTYAKPKVLDHILGIASWTKPTSMYLGLWTTDPTVSGAGGAEVSASGTAYARQLVAFDATSSSVSDNTSDITFPKATATYGATAVSYWVLFDALAGNPILYGSFTTPKLIDVNDTLVIAAGDLDLTIS